MTLIFSEYVKTNKELFLNKVKKISESLGIEPNWLMGVMMHESGLNHKAVNQMGGATGLIQFMPATARGLNTTVEALKQMSNVAQLDYVKKYYIPYRGKIKGFEDLYLVNFFPISLGKPDNWVFQSKRLSAETIAKYNPSLDLNNDKMITIGEFKKAIRKRIPKEILDELKKNESGSSL